MRERGKAVESSTVALFSDSFSSYPPCRKHPSSSSVGICAYCLKDRLIKLVCSDCGEQRLSSCSCSDISSNRNSCSVEVGSVGRISFLIENDKAEVTAAEARHHSKLSFCSSSSATNSKPKCTEKVDAAAASVLLKRNSSSSVYEKRSFWKVGWLFRKKKEIDLNSSGRNSSGPGEEGEILAFDRLSLSGSRPNIGSTSESKQRLPNLKISGFVGSETGLGGGKEAGFIDLELGSSSKSKGGPSGLNCGSFTDSEGDFACMKGGSSSALERKSCGNLKGDLVEHESDFKVCDLSALQRNGFRSLRCGILEHETGSFEHLRRGFSLSNGSSCRITVNECEIRTGGKKGAKVWKWIFKNSKGRSVRK